MITDPEDLKKVKVLLEKEALTVEKVENNKIYLYQGQKVDLQGTIESDEYMPSIVQYWEKHPETKPDGIWIFKSSWSYSLKLLLHKSKSPELDQFGAFRNNF